MTTRLTDSPWGRPDFQKEIAPGIVKLSTPSHGGYHLSAERWAELVRLMPRFLSWTGAQWLEEDCDWAAVPACWPEFFDDDARFDAHRSLSGRHPREDVGAEFWESEHGRQFTAGVEVYRATLAGKFERGGMSTDGDGWHVHFVDLAGEGLWLHLVDYPAGQWFTVAELDALPRYKES